MSSFVFNPKVRKISAWVLIISVLVMLAGQIGAYAAMTNGFTVAVSNVRFENKNGLMVRGKLFRPENATAEAPAPGVVYLHGYQNNRETSDPYGIELARRGFVVITLDTLGRGNSDNQFSVDDPGFDPTYGADSAFKYLQSLPFVDAARCGLGGHSLGGEMSYAAAVENPEVQAIVFSGYGYLETATLDNPKNMLMILGKYDEYRQRMTGTDDFEAEWMSSPQTEAAIGEVGLAFDTTYGDFADGTARRVHMTRTTHVGESFDKGAIAEAINWYHQALAPDTPLTIPANQQIWRYKEIGSLVALVAGIFSVMPAAVLLLGIKPFSDLAGAPNATYVCDRKTFRKAFLINAGLTLLFLPLILTIFGLHVYVVPIDGVFPMMMVNGVVFWFLVINVIGFFIFRGWLRKRRQADPAVNPQELGLSESKDGFKLSWAKIWRSLLLAAVLFAFLYALEAIPEALMLVDWRYKFPYASDLTGYRFLMLLLYFPLFLAGFIQVNILLQAQLRPKPGKTPLHTILRKSVVGILVMVIPLLFMMALQYVPLYTTGMVPFVGPGGALVGFVINIEHMIVLLALMVPISTVLYETTGSVYPGAVLNALIVTWMFTSSSVIAPLPI
ncbi:alpha/beta hydrolase [bacterium]|nr:alpha/beta hydrolase [bacterium]